MITTKMVYIVQVRIYRLFDIFGNINEIPKETIRTTA